MLEEKIITETLQKEMHKQWHDQEKLTLHEGSLVFHYNFFRPSYRCKYQHIPKFVIAFGPSENQKYPEFMKLQFTAKIPQNHSGHTQTQNNKQQTTSN
jgi:hypothetical protein